MSEKRIGDYALIGDGETAALVHRGGSIEWLCLPRFDSEACFAAILGDEENGSWHIGFGGEIERTRRYRGDSLILETEIVCEGGRARVTDFMPVREENPRVVRIAECLEGEVRLTSQLRLRFDYGRIHPLVRRSDDGDVVAISGPNGVSLDFDVPIEFTDRRFSSERRLCAGERTCFALTWFPSAEAPPDWLDPLTALERTGSFWADWSDRACAEGPYRDTVMRSLITLKALIYAPAGGMVASPTASLPEQSHGERNWDYRYCWLRDATFTFLALTRWGLDDEARGWIEWLRRTVGGEPIELQPFYAVDGGRRAIEWIADWLPGFNGASPVRFGNGAQVQLQLDIYGELIDSLYQAREEGVGDPEASDQLIRLLAARLEEIWQQPDAGIWESRGPLLHHTYSKVMCWVAFDRTAAWLAERDPQLSARYCQLAQRVRDQVLEKGIDPSRNCFVRAYGDSALDAAALRIPLVGFLPASDPRVSATVAAIERDLCRDGLCRRYRPEETDDGLSGDEGAFVAVSFWLAEVLHMQGRTVEARRLFERLVERANDLGLLAEQLAFGDDRQLGNFPQGLSHIALLDAADRLQTGRGGGRKAATDQ